MAVRFGLVATWFFGWGFGLLLGLVFFKYSSGVARFDERTDAIGSTRRWSEVQPAEWRVWLTQSVAQVWTFLCLVAIAAGVPMAMGLGWTAIYSLGSVFALLGGLAQYKFADLIARFASNRHWSEAEPGYGRIWLNRAIAVAWTIVCLIAIAAGGYAMIA